jgi:hypothetical protein
LQGKKNINIISPREKILAFWSKLLYWRQSRTKQDRCLFKVSFVFGRLWKHYFWQHQGYSYKSS